MGAPQHALNLQYYDRGGSLTQPSQDKVAGGPASKTEWGKAALWDFLHFCDRTEIIIFSLYFNKMKLALLAVLSCSFWLMLSPPI